MRSLGSRFAVGAGGFAGGGPEFYRGGFKARIRARFPGKVYIDLAPGILYLIHDDEHEDALPGFVGELSAGVEGVGALAFQVENVTFEDKSAYDAFTDGSDTYPTKSTEHFLGIRPQSQAGIIAAGAVVAGYVIWNLWGRL